MESQFPTKGTTFTMVAKTFQGLEDVLRDELLSLGAENVEIGKRMVSFEGDLELLYKANLCCRTALRILKPIEKFTAYDPDDLYDVVREIEWEKYMTPSTTFAIDATVNSEDFTHSKFVTYRVKDAIVDHFVDTCGVRPSIRLSNPDLFLNVHISENRVTISLDSSGEPLSKRGYRDEATEAPINEALAAGIILKSGWKGECDFADPMCGSGTFLIEAALIAANINPGIYRRGFAFEKWPNFDAELFETLYNDDSAEREFNFKIYGGDIDPDAVRTAHKNIKSAQLDDMIELSCRDIAEWIDNPEEGVLVTNPPYGRRLKPDDLAELYRNIGTCLKRNFKGWTAWIIAMDCEEFDKVGLKPSSKTPLLNGSIECSLREYVMFDGRYNDFRSEGGSIKSYDEPEEHGPRKMKRLSDDEWRRETRKFGQHDRKPQKHEDRNASYRRDDRRDGGYRDDRRDDFKPRGGKPGRKDFNDKRSESKLYTPKRPTISEDKSQVINPVHFRKRKQK
ncbi:MAG: THUMP domain-containing protein [Muribaculaceae bacterium]|nr:THUMP domain-containing protein [Bacteroidales bacterium]MDY4649735.1 THUMP domain-containing protein [Muribaculaceae bacterium]